LIILDTLLIGRILKWRPNSLKPSNW